LSSSPANVIIIQPNFIEELVTAGKLAAGEHAIIARVGIGLMVRTGADAPDVSTVELLKEVLLAADSIVFSNVISYFVLEKLYASRTNSIFHLDKVG
jgi:molybdate transport system substrate-binding protein